MSSYNDYLNNWIWAHIGSEDEEKLFIALRQTIIQFYDTIKYNHNLGACCTALSNLKATLKSFLTNETANQITPPTQNQLLALACLALYQVDQERIHQKAYTVHSSTHLSEEIATGQKVNPGVLRVGEDGELYSPLLPFVEYVIEFTMTMHNGKARPTIKMVPRTYLAYGGFNTHLKNPLRFFNKKLSNQQIEFNKQQTLKKAEREKLYYTQDHLHQYIEHQSSNDPKHSAKHINRP